MKKTTIARWLFTAGLLYAVWNESHWSVALTLSLITIRFEGADFIAEFRRRGDK